MAENGDKRLDRLFSAARGAPPDTARAEEGFEGRVAARVRGMRPGSGEWPLGAWAWRLSPLFAAVVIAVGVWTAATIPEPVPGAGTEIAAAWEAADMADFLGGGG
jgi:hypothetical protein